MSVTPIPGAKYRITVEAEGTDSGFCINAPNLHRGLTTIPSNADVIVSVEPAETLIDGAIYQDADGKVAKRSNFVTRGGDWLVPGFGARADDYMTRPLTRLVPDGEALRLLNEHRLEAKAGSVGSLVCSCGDWEWVALTGGIGPSFYAHLRSVAGGAQ